MAVSWGFFWTQQVDVRGGARTHRESCEAGTYNAMDLDSAYFIGLV